MTPIEYLYYLGHTFHKKYGLSRQKRLDGRVISIGNLTVGGTGKTPVTIAIAKKAVKKKLKTCILTRGYKGSSENTVIVSKGNRPLTSWRDVGDEPLLMAERLKEVWVVKDSNRYRGGLIAGEMDIFLLDDGFQHWQLERDIDILVIDATNPFGNGRLLPFGSLREPIDELKRADVVLINKGSGISDSLKDTIKKYNNSAPIFFATYRADGVINQMGKPFSIETLRDRKVFAFSGIGNNTHFIRTLTALGLSILSSLSYRDHHFYTDRDIKRIMKKARDTESEYIITTEKDMVKVKELPSTSELKNLFALRISLEVNSKDFYNIVLEGG